MFRRRISLGSLGGLRRLLHLNIRYSSIPTFTSESETRDSLSRSELKVPEGDFSAERRLRGTDWPVSLKESTYPKAVELYRYHLEWMTAREREAVLSRTVQKVWPFGL